mmetsp:Transcript_7168/g.13217  ORF Transcript_7168/g.13217 Transcript_7168/m.13217 type:complete len:262 (+) Transcript_7168:207-992(+)
MADNRQADKNARNRANNDALRRSFFQEKCDGKEKLIMASLGAEALMRIARANEFGHPGVNVNVPKAFEIYKMAAHLGDPDAHFELAMAYMNGDDGASHEVQKDTAKSILHFKKAVAIGGCNFLGHVKVVVPEDGIGIIVTTGGTEKFLCEGSRIGPLTFLRRGTELLPFCECRLLSEDVLAELRQKLGSFTEAVLANRPSGRSSERRPGSHPPQMGESPFIEILPVCLGCAAARKKNDSVGEAKSKKPLDAGRGRVRREIR